MVFTISGARLIRREVPKLILEVDHPGREGHQRDGGPVADAAELCESSAATRELPEPVRGRPRRDPSHAPPHRHHGSDTATAQPPTCLIATRLAPRRGWTHPGQRRRSPGDGIDRTGTVGGHRHGDGRRDRRRSVAAGGAAAGPAPTWRWPLTPALPTVIPPMAGTTAPKILATGAMAEEMSATGIPVAEASR